jgi:hypothetical protein
MKIRPFITLLLLAFTCAANAKIPEPDNIIYGLVGISGVPLRSADTNVTIKLIVNEQVLASYTMGDKSGIGDRYILRIPMDTLTPPDPYAAREGDSAIISTFVSGVESFQTPITISAPSTVTILNLGGVVDHDLDGIADVNDPDSDNDGINDVDDLCPTGATGWTSNSTTDNDADGCRDSDEDLDDDNDGFSDIDELAAGSDPLDPNSDPNTVAVEPGDVNNDGTVNTADLLICTRIALGLLSYDAACDVVGDDSDVTAGDIVIIQRTVLGL